MGLSGFLLAAYLVGPKLNRGMSGAIVALFCIFSLVALGSMSAVASRISAVQGQILEAGSSMEWFLEGLPPYATLLGILQFLLLVAAFFAALVFFFQARRRRVT